MRRHGTANTLVAALPIDVTEGQWWTAALQALAAWRPEWTYGPVKVEVVIANQLLCFALVRRPATTQPALLKKIMAAHIEEMFGLQPETHEIQFDQAGDPTVLLTVAMANSLVSELRSIFDKAPFRLTAITPLALHACERVAPNAPNGAWLLTVIEPGRIFLAAIDSRQWKSLRLVNVPHTVPGDLIGQLVSREALLAGIATPYDVYIAGDKLTDRPSGGGARSWKSVPLDLSDAMPK